MACLYIHSIQPHLFVESILNCDFLYAFKFTFNTVKNANKWSDYFFVLICQYINPFSILILILFIIDFKNFGRKFNKFI